MLDFFRNVSRRIEERRAVETLRSMDDHLLRDIGITRFDADRVVRNSRR